MRDTVKLIFDNSALIALLERLKLYEEIKQLEKEYELVVPSKVFEEFSIKADSVNQGFVRAHFKIVTNTRDETLKRFLHIESGELFVLSEGLSLQEKKEDYLCILDEQLARNVAETFEIKKTGTVGLLKIMHEKKIIAMEKLKTLKPTITGSDFRINPKHVDWIK